METFVLRWTKDNLPFWQGVDDGEKIEINAVADVINENAKLKRAVQLTADIVIDKYDACDEPLNEAWHAAVKIVGYPKRDALLTKETNDADEL